MAIAGMFDIWLVILAPCTVEAVANNIGVVIAYSKSCSERHKGIERTVVDMVDVAPVHC